MSQAQRLDFIVSLLDKVSGPAGQMMQTMDTVTSNIQTGYQKIGYGVAGLFSVGYAFEKMLAPAKEMRTALGTIASLGVENTALEHLRKTSMDTAVQYGSDAMEIVNASYKLQSAISGLKGNELSMLANKSTLLATATKGGLESTNAYVGQMFNIHALEAKAIGKTAFMDKLISKTAKAVQLFNTDGTQMGEAMKNIGKQATAMKVPLEEQLAVMGFLQNTMVQGGRSGNAYSAFLANISKAEGVLGMKFTDTQNKALPMVDIITKLQGKFGDLSKAGDQQMLQKAFGKNGQQVLAAMAGSLDTFKGNLESIKNVKGLDDINKMAASIADPWDKSAASVKNFRMEFGERLLRVFSPVYDQITQTMTTLTKWMDMFPHLTGWVIKGVIGIGVLVASISALSVVVGLSKFMIVGWSASMAIAKFALMPFGPLLTAVKAGWAAMNLSIALGNGIMATAKFGLLGMLGSLKAMMLQSKLAAATMWIFNGGLTGMAAALWANPITWIVVGVIALTAAVIAAVVYWDEWTSKLVEWGAIFLDFIGVFNFVDAVLAVWDKIPEWWQALTSWFTSLDMGSAFKSLIDPFGLIDGVLAVWNKIPEWWQSLTGWFASLDIGSAFQLLLDPFGLIDGVLAVWHEIPEWWQSLTNWFASLDIGSAFQLLLDPFGLIDGVLALWNKIPEWWQSLTDWFASLDIGSTFQLLLSPFALIDGVLAVWNKIPEWWQSLTGWFASLDIGSAFQLLLNPLGLIDGVLAVWNKLSVWWLSFKNWIGSINVFSFLGDSIDWLIDKINMIPGINIDTSTDMPKPVSAPASLSNNAAPRMMGGGLVSQISNATSNSNKTIGDVHVNNYGQAMSGQTLANELAFAAG